MITFKNATPDFNWMTVSDFPAFTFGIFSDNSRLEYIVYCTQKYIHFIDKQWYGLRKEKKTFFVSSKIRKLLPSETITITGD